MPPSLPLTVPLPLVLDPAQGKLHTTPLYALHCLPMSWDMPRELETVVRLVDGGGQDHFVRVRMNQGDADCNTVRTR